MMSAILWRVLLLGIAVVTIGVQMDRQARRTPAVAVTVPEPFRATAQFPLAAYALAGDDPHLALAQAEKLIRRRPLPAEHLRVLAQAQVAAGQLNRGATTIQYAAQRGWREPLAQESLLRLALEAGDTDEAARRYAALFLRRDTEDSLLQELGPRIVAEPGGEGRQTLITIVGGGQRWHGQFLGRGARVMPPDAFVEIIRDTTDSGTRYECSSLEQAGKVLGQRDEAAGQELNAIISGQC